MQLTSELAENVKKAKELFPIGKSFDILTRDLYLGKTKAFFFGINGLCRTDILQQIFSDLQNPLYMEDNLIKDIEQYMNTRLGYAQVSLTDNWETIVHNVLSGPTVLLIDGFAKAILIDVRTYPTRGIEEPEVEKVTRGARDGFVETMLFNTNLIRRRIRSPRLTFEVLTVGSDSQTDVAIAYLMEEVNTNLLSSIKEALKSLHATSLTMGSKSLEELLVKKRWFNPLPSIHATERPDVACSFLEEGHIILIVDNSPSVLILPSNIFQFTQCPEDYYKAPLVGGYFRAVRFACIPISLLLLPLFLLIAAYFPDLAHSMQLMETGAKGPVTIIFYVFAVEFLLDLFKYSAALNSRFSGSLSVVGGLIIGDIAVTLNWATTEILFYAAVTLLTTLSLSSVEFSDGLRIYRMFLIITTSLFGLYGFASGLLLILLSALTTPTVAGLSYFWPLFPFHWKALRTLLFRYPTAKAQPSSIWRR